MADVDVLNFCVLIVIPHHMKNNVVITVSLQKIFLAEARIVGCDKCSDEATIHFERLFDDAADDAGTQRLYLLPEPAICPFCHSAITEKTLVQLRDERYRISGDSGEA
jgi:hypothetical protein